ncbi:hypothetical protein ABZ930_02985 [Streptomyces sp. NPDC046716]|uniref:hypothetical protein n=1 Tax=Streptomyces sp. NPDC046716 TaxID=3157093 RepID=UPI003404EE33
MDHRLRLVWWLVVGVGAIVIALDYRNIALKFYDLMAARSPGGGIDPRFTPDVLRVLAGVLGVACLVVVAVQAVSAF